MNTMWYSGRDDTSCKILNVFGMISAYRAAVNFEGYNMESSHIWRVDDPR